MTNISNKGFWLWGVFDNKSTENLKSINKILNAKLVGPSFYPHLTLFGPINSLNDSDKENIKKICAKTKKFELEINKLEIGSSKYQSVYLLPKFNKILLDMRSNLIKKLKPIKKQSEYLPHISLYYGDKTEIDKKKAISESNLIVETIIFKSICYVYVDEEKDLWKITERFDLS